MVNMAMKEIANSIAVVKRIEPPHIVPIQLKIFIPVGIAIAMVETAKAEFAAGPSPTVNMWWLQTNQPMKPIATPAKTRNEYPKSGLRENTGKISETIPIAGKMRMYTSGCPKSQKTCCQRTGVATCGGVVEVGAVEAVYLQLNECYGQDGEC